MNNTIIIMEGILKIVVVLALTGAMMRLFDIADTYFNKKDKD